MGRSSVEDRRERSEQLRRVARRCVWWQPPGKTLRHRDHFLAHAMTFGLWQDVQAVRKFYTDDELRAALRAAPPGVFDPRSWHYWHRVLGLRKIPPLPVRRIPGVEASMATSKLTFHERLRKPTRSSWPKRSRQS